ncbi:hypothetical protein, partial [Rariglobus hedericola]
PTPASPASKAGTDEKGDLDGGTQRMAETRKLPFKLSLAYDLQVFYTDNVFLQPNNEVETVVIANTLVARAEGNSIAVGQGLLLPSLSLVYQRYNHDLFGGDQARQNLDFDAYSIPFQLRYRCGNNWEFGFGITGTAVYSLEGPPDYNLTYKSISTALTARKLVSLGRDHILSFGAGVTYFITDAEAPAGPLGFNADRNDKIDYTVDAGYYYLKDRWVVGPYARLTYSDYLHFQEGAFTDVSRSDLTGSIGVSVSYSITPWASARIYSSYDWRTPQGDEIVDYSYKSANLGAGATLSMSF